MKDEFAIRVQNVSKDFGQERVLHSVSRDFASGQIHGIVGAASCSPLRARSR